MAVETHQINVDTQGNTHVVDITPLLVEKLNLADISVGIAAIFVVGSTAGVTTVEYEPGLVNHDLKAFFERVASESGHYEHEKMWNDDNGHSHIRASMIGPSLTVPIRDRQPMLGTWQQIVLIDFDTRPRRRSIVVQLIGE